MNDRLDALEALLNSAGWKLFAEYAKDEWGPAACWRKAKASGADPIALQIVDATNVNVGALMNWPVQEVQRLKRVDEKQEPVMSRGGYSR